MRSELFKLQRWCEYLYMFYYFFGWCYIFLLLIGICNLIARRPTLTPHFMLCSVCMFRQLTTFACFIFFLSYTFVFVRILGTFGAWKPFGLCVCHRQRLSVICARLSDFVRLLMEKRSFFILSLLACYVQCFSIWDCCYYCRSSTY